MIPFMNIHHVRHLNTIAQDIQYQHCELRPVQVIVYSGQLPDLSHKPTMKSFTVSLRFEVLF